MTKILSFFNHKGGVGKTTSTLNLGYTLLKLGYKTLLIDLDPQANLTQALGIDSPEDSLIKYFETGNLDDVPFMELESGMNLIPSALDLENAVYSLINDIEAQYKLQTLVENIQHNFDYILLDCPPSLNILSVNALVASTEVIVVVEPSKKSIVNLPNVMNTIATVQKRHNRNLKGYRILINGMKDLVIRKKFNEAIRNEYGKSVLKSEISDRVAIEEASGVGQNISIYSPESHSAKEYHQLAMEIIA